MFSGGLDSLAGAVQEAIVSRRKVLLVNHRSTPKLSPRLDHLRELLNSHAGPAAPLHIPVHVNKAKALSREYTQRSRSFLFAALGATYASMIGLNRFRFYENGVVSLNLPLSAQIVGARASRTTHPRVLRALSQLLTSVAGKPFSVENPFLWETKTDVVRRIANAGCAELIKHSTSCGHTWAQTRQHPHCGDCSQCIDRRFAILAAGQEASEPADSYAVDLLTGPRDEGVSRALITGYLHLAEQVEEMTDRQFFSQFGEAYRVIKNIDGPPNDVAARIFNLYQHHAREVNRVIDRAMSEHHRAIRRGKLPPGCLLRLVYGDGTEADPDSIPPDPEPPPGNATGEQPRNSVRRRCKCWGIRFDGQEERVYTPEIGFNYLVLLLEQPGRSFSASELAGMVGRRTHILRMRTATSADLQPGSEMATEMTDGEDILDDEGKENLTVRLSELEELIEVAQASDSPTRLDTIEELQTERQQIMRALSEAGGFNGRSRKTLNDRNRVRNRVCNAIKRALAEIKEFDPRLAEHLKRPILNLGHTLSYVPRDNTVWEIGSAGA